MFEYEKIKKLKNKNLTLLLENIYQKTGTEYYLLVYKIYFHNKFHPIGVISYGINVPQNKEHLGNIGYNIKKKYRQRGHATEACITVLDMIQKNGVKAIIITCDKNHKATPRICEKLGGILTKETSKKLFYTILL